MFLTRNCFFLKYRSENKMKSIFAKFGFLKLTNSFVNIGHVIQYFKKNNYEYYLSYKNKKQKKVSFFLSDYLLKSNVYMI